MRIRLSSVSMIAHSSEYSSLHTRPSQNTGHWDPNRSGLGKQSSQSDEKWRMSEPNVGNN